MAKLTWRSKVGQRIARMSVSECSEWMKRFQSEGVTINHESVREITGGLASQSVNAYVSGKIGRKATGREWRN